MAPGNASNGDSEMEMRLMEGMSAPSKGTASQAPTRKVSKAAVQEVASFTNNLRKIFILFVVQNSENQNRLKPLERVEGGARHGPWDRNP